MLLLDTIIARGIDDIGNVGRDGRIKTFVSTFLNKVYAVIGILIA